MVKRSQKLTIVSTTMAKASHPTNAHLHTHGPWIIWICSTFYSKCCLRSHSRCTLCIIRAYVFACVRLFSSFLRFHLLYAITFHWTDTNRKKYIDIVKNKREKLNSHTQTHSNGSTATFSAFFYDKFLLHWRFETFEWACIYLHFYWVKWIQKENRKTQQTEKTTSTTTSTTTAEV